MPEKRMKGTISRMNVDQGYFFISSKEMPFKRIYCHWTFLDPSIEFKELKRGQEVEFTPYPYQNKGFRATDVKLVGGKDDKSQANIREREGVVEKDTNSGDVPQSTTKEES